MSPPPPLLLLLLRLILILLLLSAEIDESVDSDVTVQQRDMK